MSKQTRGLQARQLQDSDRLLALRYVPLAQLTQWERNPKVHDLPGIIASLKKYGFQYPPKYDQTLNGGQGGIVFGNGRVEALTRMKAQGEPPPQGITVDQASGDWAAPVIFGNDLPSQVVAEAFAIDHNNLVMAGGDFTAMYMTQMWDETRYASLLADLGVGQLPVTVSELDLEVLEEVLLSEPAPRQRPDKGAKIRLGMYRFYVPRELYEAWAAELVASVGEEKAAIVAELKRRLRVPEIEPEETEADDEQA